MQTALIAIIVSLLAIVALSIILIVSFAKGRKDIFSKDSLNLVSDMGALKSQMAAFANDLKSYQQIIQELKDLVYNDSKTGDRVKSNIEDTMRAIEAIRQRYEASRKVEEENFQSLRRLEGIIAGAKSKGIAGENIVREALSVLPPAMVQANFKVKGKEVEFGMVLSNKKIIPIDSKWTSTELLEAIANAESQQEKERLANQIQKEVTRRVSEVSQYLDPNTSAPWAIAAIPDSAYSLCRDAHLTAYSKNVILVSYSMLLPYILMFFSLHLQYSSSIDIENLTHYLIDIKRNLGQMNEILENKIVTAQTMLYNASQEYRKLISSLKGSIASLESQRPEESENSLPIK